MDINVRQLKPLLVVLIAGLLITGPLTAKDMNRDRQVFFENEYGKENIVKITTETRGGGFLQDPDYYTIIELTDGRVIEYTGVNANQLMYNRERRSANKK